MAGIYIHIPFCKKRCIYCDFYSNTDMTWQTRYIDAVCRELSDRKEELSGETIETVYLGGGTPSQLSIDSLSRIFRAIESHFPLSSTPEITLEANPDDLQEEFCRELSELPINRISMGIQSFDDRDLRFLNRRHNARQATTAIENCRRSGFSNISIDLIYGLPHQTPESWNDNLQQAFSLSPEHLSCYHLIYEEGTEIYRLLKNGIIRPVDEETSLTMFSRLMETARDNGYRHYEISNFARPGYESRHNSSYWQGKSYLGIGASAHSYNGKDVRKKNAADIRSYIAGEMSGRPHYEIERLSETDRYNERILTALRTDDGLNIDRLRNEFGTFFYRYCLAQSRSYLERGWLEQHDRVLKVSRSGIFISDSILSDLMYVE